MLGLSLALLALGAVVAHAIPTRRNNVGQDAFDFIVVGAEAPAGGTAGLTVAGRLSELNATVLVVEAGGRPDPAGLDYSAPAFTGALQGSPYDWNFTAQADAGVGGRVIRQNRGRCLGGTSSWNGLTYGRGSRSIFDGWAALGNEGWEWDAIQPYFQRTFDLVAPNNTDFYRTFDPTFYSESGGPARLGYTTYEVSSTNGFVEACAAIGIPTSLDLNGGNNTGAKHELSTLDPITQTRSNSYTAFYNASSSRPNFSSLTYALATGILTEDGVNGTTATGVTVTYLDNGGKRVYRNVTANREVVLSAGVFQSPQLLMLSGIGPKAELSKHNIDVVVENPNVGQNLQDPLSFSLIFKAKQNASTSQFSLPDAQARAEAQYNRNSTGPIARIDGSSGPAYAFESYSEDELRRLNASGLIDANRTSQDHIEYIHWTSFYPNTSTPYFSTDANQSFLSLAVFFLSPLSRGNVTLRSSDPFEAPVITPNYYSDADNGDLSIHVHGFKRARELAAQQAYSQYTVGDNSGEVIPGVERVPTDDDDAIINHIRTTAVSTAHQQGTCAMLPRDQGGVVDPRLRVYDVDRLRIVDASIFPYMADQHPTGSIYMAAEKAVDMIREDQGL